LTVNMNDRIRPGPAPGRVGSPAAAVPIVANMPAPIIAPIPSAVTSTGPRAFFNRCSGSSASATNWSMVFRRKTSFSISAAESVLQGEKLGLKIRCRTAKLCQFGFRPVEFEPQQIGQLLELSEKRADILQVRKHGVSILIAFTAKHNVAASILSCHNVSSGNLRKVNYFTIHSRSINGHLRHRYRQPKPPMARAPWVEKQHSTTPLHRRPMRVTDDHTLT